MGLFGMMREERIKRRGKRLKRKGERARYAKRESQQLELEAKLDADIAKSKKLRVAARDRKIAPFKSVAREFGKAIKENKKAKERDMPFTTRSKDKRMPFTSDEKRDRWY